MGLIVDRSRGEGMLRAAGKGCQAAGSGEKPQQVPVTTGGCSGHRVPLACSRLCGTNMNAQSTAWTRGMSEEGQGLSKLCPSAGHGTAPPSLGQMQGPGTENRKLTVGMETVERSWNREGNKGAGGRKEHGESQAEVPFSISLRFPGRPRLEELLPTCRSRGARRQRGAVPEGG